IGGHGPRLLRTAARHADLCNIGFDLPVGEWRQLGPLLAAYARQAGRMPGAPVLTHNATVLLGSDEADFSRLVSAWASRRGLSEESARQKLEHSLAGTPRQVCERLKALEATGWAGYSSSSTTHAISPGCGCSLRRSCRSCEVVGAGSSACARRARPEFSYRTGPW